MQLLLTLEELRLLANVLGHPTDDPRQRAFQSHALDMVLTRNLGFSYDEFEDLAELVKRYLGSAHEPPIDPHERESLEHVLDKLTEACAMA